MAYWQLAEAKKNLNELVNRALEDGPQRITRRGDTVVVISEAQFRLAVGDQPSLAQYLCDGPSLDGMLTESDRGIRDVTLLSTVSQLDS